LWLNILLYYNENENILLRFILFYGEYATRYLMANQNDAFSYNFIIFLFIFITLVADYRWGSILILNCVAFNSNFMQIILERFALKISKRTICCSFRKGLTWGWNEMRLMVMMMVMVVVGDVRLLEFELFFEDFATFL
jgi:hypothetical protein